MDATASMTAGNAGVAPAFRHESEIAGDLARRAAMVAPIVVLVAGLVRGVDGAVSASVALLLVAANFLVAARLVGWAAGKGLGAVYAAVLGGYVVRLAALAGIVVGLERVSWIDVPVLVVAIAVTHLGLLVWELRYVSLSLAAPGLKPTVRPILSAGSPSPDQRIRDQWNKEHQE